MIQYKYMYLFGLCTFYISMKLKIYNHHICEKSESPSRAWLGLVNTEFDIVKQA